MTNKNQKGPAQQSQMLVYASFLSLSSGVHFRQSWPLFGYNHDGSENTSHHRLGKKSNAFYHENMGHKSEKKAVNQTKNYHFKRKELNQYNSHIDDDNQVALAARQTNRNPDVLSLKEKENYIFWLKIQFFPSQFYFIYSCLMYWLLPVENLRSETPWCRMMLERKPTNLKWSLSIEVFHD